ncbi:6112_t:CDS:1, partial [Scutellospora calospora]
LKINHLRNIKQGEKEILRGYTSRFKAYLDAVKNRIRSDKQRDWYLDRMRETYRMRVENFCPRSFIKAKECAFQIENFQRDREQKDKKGISMVGEKSHSSDPDVDGITATLEALTLNRVKQENNNDSKIDKIESDIKELMKVVKELTSNNSSATFSRSRSLISVQNPRAQRRNVDNRQCFNCQQEGHISRNCLSRTLQNPLVERENEQRDVRNGAVETGGGTFDILK